MPDRARHPLAVLVVLALVPALAIAALWTVAESRAADDSSAPATTTTFVPPAPLTTPVLSVRRQPGALALDQREDVLVASLATLFGAVDGASCAAVSVDDRPVGSVNPALPVMPASTLKLVTTAVGLDVLGADHRFVTEVRGATPVDGVVEGDLYLVGGGDPVLSEAWFTQPTFGRKRPPIHTTSAEQLADAIVAAGVTTITGDLVGDGSRYDEERYPPTWGSDLRGTLDAQPIGALAINDSFSTNGAIASDPALSAATTLRRLLRERGVTVQGDASTGVAPAGPPLASVASAPLSELVNEILATSDNIAAEMLLKELGFAAGLGGTRDAGLQVVHTRLGEWGVSMAGVALVDGSGLSRDNRITCDALLGVLRHGDVDDPVGQGLATGGQAGTTLVDVFTGAGLSGVLRAKTGSLTGVKALAGYFPAGTEEVAFVLVLNGDAAAASVERWTQLTDALLATAAVPGAEAWAAP
ncbi:MAG TPA: D-alanyl-D-alanine carboxypeptidase/D-alanyl-D-alanine-endopeptidase [Ilumatobacteraceae bacterium]|nr:D-alanyl-D-alanine carboxypeptidase/D-alanyl-D-alanine-endopeptidase [Ilumatobacteraceae bacterium]